MDPLHLKKDELDYELGLRGIFNLSSQRTKTSALREALLRERVGIESEPNDSCHLYPSSTELENCTLIYDNIVFIAQSPITGKASLRECSSRLLHLKGRLKRVKVLNSNEEYQANELQKCVIDAMDNISMQLGDIPEPVSASSACQPKDNSQNSKSPLSQSSSNRIAQSNLALGHHIGSNNQPQRRVEPQSIIAERISTAMGSVEDFEEGNPRNESLFNTMDLTPEEVRDIENELQLQDPLPQKQLDNTRPNSVNFPTPRSNTEQMIPPFRNNFGSGQLRSENVDPSNRVSVNINAIQPLQPRNNRDFLMPTQSLNNPNTSNIRAVGFRNHNIARNEAPFHNPTFQNHIENYHSYRIHNERNHNVHGYRPEAFQQAEREVYRNMNRERRGIPIHQWRIMYSGDDRGTHLYDFLSQVEVLRRSEQYTERELLTSIIHLLSGRARLWYHSSYENFQTWNQFVSALKSEFLPPNYDYILLSDISNRFQKQHETFSEFIMHMQSLFRCLSCPISEDYKLFLVRKNLLPRYAIGIAPLDIVNLQELSEACKRIDGALNRQQLQMPFQNYSRPNRFNARPQYRNPQEINPIEDVIPFEGNKGEPEIAALENRREGFPNNIRRAQNPRNNKCWNCHASGHLFQNCRQPRNIFCYKCGTQNTTYPKCPKCQGNEKQNQGVQGNDQDSM